MDILEGIISRSVWQQVRQISFHKRATKVQVKGEGLVALTDN